MPPSHLLVNTRALLCGGAVRAVLLAAGARVANDTVSARRTSTKMRMCTRGAEVHSVEIGWRDVTCMAVIDGC